MATDHARYVKGNLNMALTILLQHGMTGDADLHFADIARDLALVEEPATRLRLLVDAANETIDLTECVMGDKADEEPLPATAIAWRDACLAYVNFLAEHVAAGNSEDGYLAKDSIEIGFFAALARLFEQLRRMESN